MKFRQAITISVFMISAQIGITVANAREASAPSERAPVAPYVDASAPIVEKFIPTADRIEEKDQSNNKTNQNRNRIEHHGIVFKWGDVSWLPELASRAGWPEKTHAKLTQIVLRESGGCPNRMGGDAVNKNCVITHVTEWNHRSDTGLLQINGVNYNIERNKWAIACRKMNVCEQELLLDPLTNLQVGYLLYQEAGWDPWDPCAWGEEYAKRCEASKKP